MGHIAQSIGQYQDWTPTLGGFSSQPTIATSRKCLDGKKCHIQFAMTAVMGNSTSFTITLPHPSKSLIVIVGGQAVDNNTTQATPMVAILTAGSQTATLYKSPAQTAWTTNSIKGVRFEFTYEIE